MTTDNVDVTLRNDVADTGDVYFIGGKTSFNEASNGINVLLNVGLLRAVQFVEFDFLGVRYKNEPGKQGVF